MKQSLWIGLFAATCMAFSPPAMAEGKKPHTAKVAKKKKAHEKAPKTKKASEAVRETARIQKQDDGYSYVFRDDPLSGSGRLGSGQRIRVRQHGARQTLIRPRLDFIPELLKSVEDI